MDMKDKNRSLIKEYAMKWNLHDIKRACQVNGFPAFFGIVMLFGLLSGGVSRADEEIYAQWITIQDCGGSGRHTCVQG